MESFRRRQTLSDGRDLFQVLIEIAISYIYHSEPVQVEIEILRSKNNLRFVADKNLTLDQTYKTR